MAPPAFGDSPSTPGPQAGEVETTSAPSSPASTAHTDNTLSDTRTSLRHDSRLGTSGPVGGGPGEALVRPPTTIREKVLAQQREQQQQRERTQSQPLLRRRGSQFEDVEEKKGEEEEARTRPGAKDSRNDSGDDNDVRCGLRSVMLLLCQFVGLCCLT